MSVFGPIILIVLGGSKSSGAHISEKRLCRFGTHLTANHLGTSFVLIFGPVWDQMSQKGPYLAKNAKFNGFWAKTQFFGGEEVELLVPSYQGANEAPLSC